MVQIPSNQKKLWFTGRAGIFLAESQQHLERKGLSHDLGSEQWVPLQSVTQTSHVALGKSFVLHFFLYIMKNTTCLKAYWEANLSVQIMCFETLKMEGARQVLGIIQLQSAYCLKSITAFQCSVSSSWDVEWQTFRNGIILLFLL